MNFLFPTAFFFTVLVPVIVALYLRRPRRQAVEVSTLLFWQKILQNEPRRRFLGRLRNPLSLFLQLLILLLLLLALARPEFGGARAARNTVVILDARARMQANDGAVFRDAVKAARSIVSQAAPENQLAFLAVEGSTQVLSPFSGDGRDLRNRLASLVPSDGGGDIQQAIVLGRHLLQGKTGTKQLVVITDRPISGLEESEQILVGTPAANAAILALSQRPLPASPQSAEIFAKVGNFSAKTQNTELELALDDRPFDLIPFSLAPGEEKDFSTLMPEELLHSGQGFLTARLSPSDALGVDDTARAVMPPGKRLRILLVAAGNPFLENALKADPCIAVDILNPEAWRPGMGGSFDAVVFDNWLPEDASLTALGAGNFLFFGRSPFASGEEISLQLPLESSETGSPLLWNVDLTSSRVARAGKLRPPEDSQWRVSAPVQCGGETMIMTLEKPGGQRVAAIAFNLDASNFPLRAGFPLFISNAIRWLAGHEATDKNAYAAGETFLPDEGQAISTIPRRIHESPTLKDKPLPLTKSPLWLKKNGFYEVLPAGDSEATARWIAVNTANAAESDLRESRQSIHPLFLPTLRAALPLWQWLVLAALLLLLTEWLLYHRRVTE